MSDELPAEELPEYAPPPEGSVRERITISIPRNVDSTMVGQFMNQIITFDRKHKGEVTWVTEPAAVQGTVGNRVIGEARW